MTGPRNHPLDRGGARGCAPGSGRTESASCRVGLRKIPKDANMAGPRNPVADRSSGTGRQAPDASWPRKANWVKITPGHQRSATVARRGDQPRSPHRPTRSANLRIQWKAPPKAKSRSPGDPIFMSVSFGGRVPPRSDDPSASCDQSRQRHAVRSRLPHLNRHRRVLQLSATSHGFTVAGLEAEPDSPRPSLVGGN
jgi:hypothetical protein